KKGFLMVTMFATMLSFANESTFLTVARDAKKTVLTLNSVKEGNLLTIIDANGVVLYKEEIKEAGNYQKAFDLSSLPDGNYIFELEKDLEVDTIPFTVNSSEVAFDRAHEKVTYKPYARVEDGVVYVSKLSLNESPLKVDIYYGNSVEANLVYSETIKHTKNIQKAYKLNGFAKGNYRIVFKTDGKIYSQNI
ncbi:hypothetical protein, partial [Neotamlana nanhaiensis]|uniref:hypothetical protein n=1 Tax=Neotamlana nanhaiensis TaxID=1382798 RepID=UPI001EE27167